PRSSSAADRGRGLYRHRGLGGAGGLVEDSEDTGVVRVLRSVGQDRAGGERCRCGRAPDAPWRGGDKETPTKPPTTSSRSADLGTSPRSAELETTPEAVGAARSYITDVLVAWEVPEDLIDTARLLTSELATNAVTHSATAGGTFTLEVRSFGCCL